MISEIELLVLIYEGNILIGLMPGSGKISGASGASPGLGAIGASMSWAYN